MINCRIVFLNGTINSGKSTLAAKLSQQVKDAVYLEGDLSVPKEGLSHQQWLVATVMTSTLKACELAHEGKLPFVAFPLRDSDWKIIKCLCGHAGVQPICITLDPGQEAALQKRSDRELSSDEVARIKEMYQEGFHQRSFSSLTLQNGSESVEQICQKIEKFIQELPPSE